MKVWAAIYNIFAILIITMLSLAYLNVTKVMQRDFDQARLNQAVEYSTEAAFRGAIGVEDIGTDYSSMESVTINPGSALDTFETMMCFNYDLSTSDTNKKAIEQSIACGALSGSDGYYVTQLTEDNKSLGNTGKEYNLRWSAKIPYFVTLSNKTYAINIKKKTWASISSVGTLNVPTDGSVGYPLGLTDEQALKSVNTQITNSLLAEIDNKNNTDSFGFKFFLPVKTTKSGVNPMNGPGILMLVQNAGYASPEKIEAVAVSGYKTISKINVVAFTEDVGGAPRKFYCYETQIDPSDIGTKYTIINYYHSTQEAAKDGYEPNYALLAKKITRE